MKWDKSGLLLVGAAAAVLLLVVKKSTPSGTPATSGQGAVGSTAASFWSNVVNNLAGSPPSMSSSTSSNGIGQSLPGGVSLFGNGTFDVGGIYNDPGQVTVNTNTGQVAESPLSGMYGLLSPATYGM